MQEPNLNMYRVEYLITVDPKDKFCISIPAFNSLLATLDGLAVSSNELEFGNAKYGYEIQIGEISSDKQKFFHLKLTCHAEKDLKAFSELLRAIRMVLHKASGKPVQSLWDDISFFYAQKSYPLIYSIENIMRKLITKFMLINVGLGWADGNIPTEVIESVRSKSAKNSQNYLYEVDFIQLSNFLFKNYSTVATGSVLEKIRKAKNISDLDLNDLRSAVPQSNWERYFSAIVECEATYFQSRWERLYEKRNQIAHSKNFSVLDYEEVLSLVNELQPILKKAIDSLDQINVSKEDREVVAENVAADRNASLGEFLNAWSSLHHALLELALLTTPDPEKQKIIQKIRYNTSTLVGIVAKNMQLPAGMLAGITELTTLRNIIVHQPDSIPPDESLRQRIEEVATYRDVIWNLLNKLQNQKKEQEPGPG